jgi:plasmid stabilization system protein ParE
VARVELTAGAVRDLDRLILTHSLPVDTRARVRETLRPLERFPRLGAEIRDGGPRFLLGPWHWLVVVYAYLDDEDRVVVLSIEDGRSARAETARRA